MLCKKNATSNDDDVAVRAGRAAGAAAGRTA
jgi:hypothetical protein